MKKGGKEVGPAAVYAKPHTMDGKSMKISNNPGKPSELSSTADMRMSVGMYNNGPEKTTKTSGIKLGIIHIAFGGSNNQFELLISAVVDVLLGIVIVNVVVDVLSEPKSRTAIDLLPRVTL